MPAPIDTLAAATRALAGNEITEALDTVKGWEAADWSRALLDLPLDERDFHNRFLAGRRATIIELCRWWSDPKRRLRGLSHKATGYLGFFLLTLVSMHCSDRMRFHSEGYETIHFGESAPAPGRICGDLVANRHVQQAIKHLYDPRPRRFRWRRNEDLPSPLTLREWKKINFDSLRFHRSGTTSIILSGLESTPSKGRTSQFALKCLIFPYQNVPAIATATRDYLDVYGQVNSETPSLVGVWASHDSWILMDFVPGRTLAEYLYARPGQGEPKREILRPIRIDELDALGSALLRALVELEGEHQHHDDLSPSNIIIEERADGGEPRMRFIDLGPNHLHTRAVTGVSHGEAVYVAPEVRAEGNGDDRADLYSLGLLLISIAGIKLNSDGTLPDQFYVASVGLARLLEDLIDTDPDRRLLVSGITSDEDRYAQIATLFRNEMTVVRESAKTEPTGWWERLRSISPGAGTVARQRAILKVRKSQAEAETDTADPGLSRWPRVRTRMLAMVKGRKPGEMTVRAVHLRRSRRRLRWSWLCAILVWCSAAVVGTWWARDFGIGWQAKWLEILNIVFRHPGPDIIFIDDIRASDYPIDDRIGSLPARIVGATFTLVNARLYLNVLADLSPLSSLPRKGMLRLRTIATEVALRSFAVLPSICVIVPTLMQRDWWPIATQIGLTLTAILITTCLWFQRDAHRRARAAGLSTVPDVAVPPGRLGQWRPMLLLYLVTVLVIGTLIMLDLLHDELVYAGFVSLINIAMNYFKNAGADAPLVRTEMNRAFLAAERLDHLEARRRTITSQRKETPAMALVDA